MPERQRVVFVDDEAAERGEPELAMRDAERALVVHRDLKDAVLETEDLRILAVALGTAGKVRDAEDMLRAVIHRATAQERPLLVAGAQRDLAHLLALLGDVAAAKPMAQTARATFDRLGAKVEIQKLDVLLAIPDLLVAKQESERMGPHAGVRDDVQRGRSGDRAPQE